MVIYNKSAAFRLTSSILARTARHTNLPVFIKKCITKLYCHPRGSWRSGARREVALRTALDQKGRNAGDNGVRPSFPKFKGSLGKAKTVFRYPDP